MLESSIKGHLELTSGTDEHRFPLYLRGCQIIEAFNMENFPTLVSFYVYLLKNNLDWKRRDVSFKQAFKSFLLNGDYIVIHIVVAL